MASTNLWLPTCDVVTIVNIVMMLSVDSSLRLCRHKVVVDVVVAKFASIVDVVKTNDDDEDCC